MASSSSQVGWGVLSLLAAGCFVDSVGNPPPIGGSVSDGGGGSTSNFTGGAGTAGAPMGGAGGIHHGGEGGGESPPNCGDGTAVAGEECEDGNLDPGDGCDASCQFESMCGNGAIEPTEDCDQGPNCAVDCKAVAGSGCADAVGHQDPVTNETIAPDASNNPFPITANAGEWNTPLELCDPVGDVMNPTNVYRIQVGPYPEGVFIKVRKNGNLDPVLSLYQGCGDGSDALLFCHHADDAFVVSDVVPAGSVMFATVGDRADGGDFDMFLWFHRFWATFDTLEDFTIDPGTWYQGGSKMIVGGIVTDADGAALITDPIFVGNLATFEVVARYGFDSSDLNVAVSFDGGPWEQEREFSGAGYASLKWSREEFENPTNAQHAQVRISYVDTDVFGDAHVMALRVQPVAPFNTW